MNKYLLLSFAAALTITGITASAVENILAPGEWKATAYPERVSKTFDSKLETGWISYGGKNAAATLTGILPEAADFQALKLLGGNLGGGSVEITENGKDWKKIGDLKPSNRNGMLSLYLPEPVSVKGIRLNLKSVLNKVGPIDVREMAAYIPDTPVSLAMFCTISEAGPGVNWRFSPIFLVDGDTRHRGSHYSGYKGSTITVDLGENKEVSSVGFICRRPFDKVTVLTSADGKSWTKAGEAVKLASEKMLEFPKVKARYLQIAVQTVFQSAPAELIVR